MANSSLKQILNEARDSGALEIEGAKLDFAIALARLLEVSKMSRSELAKALQVSLPMVTKILRGDTNLTIETMVRAVRAAKGEPVAWRGINDLGEVVTDWIDGPKPARLFDLCGNESGYASYQVAYTAPPAPRVDVDAISVSVLDQVCADLFRFSNANQRDHMRAALRAIFNKGE